MNMQNNTLSRIISELKTMGIQATIKKSDGSDYVSIGLSTSENGSFADYYELGCPWISKALITYAEKNGGFWEWYDPEEIVLAN